MAAQTASAAAAAAPTTTTATPHNNNSTNNKNALATAAATTTTSTNTSAKQPLLPQPRQHKYTVLEWREAVAGIFAATLSRTIMAPVERVKLILQLQQQQQQQAQRPSSSTSSSLTAFQAARNIYRQEGVVAFWRGNLPSVLRVGGTSAIAFTCLDYYKRALIQPWLQTTTFRHSSTTTPPPQWWSSFLSSGMAGATATTFLYPLEFVRTRMAVDHTGTAAQQQQQQFRSMRHCLTTILAKDGPRGLYQGYGVALVGGVYYRILYLGGYDAAKAEMLQRCHAQQLTWGQRVALAQSISLGAGTLSYPMDSIRRRMMMQAGRTERLYRNGWHCFRTIWRTEGVRGFFLGLGPNMVRSVGGAMLLVAYDTMRTWLEPSPV